MLLFPFFANIPQWLKLHKATVVPKWNEKNNTVVLSPERPLCLHTPSWIENNSQLLLNNHYSQYEIRRDLIWCFWSCCAWFIQTEFKSFPVTVSLGILRLTEGFVLHSVQWPNAVIKSLTSHFTSVGWRRCSLIRELAIDVISFI